MSYQVLARKWRPQKFSDVIGQDHVVRALTNALEANRLHHAYLFTGTRGVGKTSIARILAKAVNCEARKGPEPCGECGSCQSVEEGRHTDLIEVDAASRTKVEDTRDLLENVQYAPGQGGFKVYLIDEVHMLSAHSFNALLKTLEEPPAHVKFLLATTDPQKIPVTVLSRCLQLNLKRMPPDKIQSQMAAILDQENVNYESSGLVCLAYAADGSMRDGLSLLDQAIAYGGGAIREKDVLAMLGTASRQSLNELLMQLAEGDIGALLTSIESMAEAMVDFSDVLRQLLLKLHKIGLHQLAPDALSDSDDLNVITGLAKAMAPEDVQLYYQCGLIGQRDLPLAPDPKTGFEMTVLRMLAFKPAKPAGGITDPSPSVSADESNPDRTESQAHMENEQITEKQNEKGSSGSAGVDKWPEIIRAAGVSAMARELANHCVLQSLDENECVLLLDPKHQQLQSERVRNSLRQALENYFTRPLSLKIDLQEHQQPTPSAELIRQRDARQKDAVQSIEHDENVKALKQVFDAGIIEGSIKPLD